MYIVMLTDWMGHLFIVAYKMDKIIYKMQIQIMSFAFVDDLTQPGEQTDKCFNKYQLT